MRGGGAGRKEEAGCPEPVRGRWGDPPPVGAGAREAAGGGRTATPLRIGNAHQQRRARGEPGLPDPERQLPGGGGGCPRPSANRDQRVTQSIPEPRQTGRRRPSREPEQGSDLASSLAFAPASHSVPQTTLHTPSGTPPPSLLAHPRPPAPPIPSSYPLWPSHSQPHLSPELHSLSPTASYPPRPLPCAGHLVHPPPPIISSHPYPAPSHTLRSHPPSPTPPPPPAPPDLPLSLCPCPPPLQE